MKKIIFMLIVSVALGACKKEDIDENTGNNGNDNTVVPKVVSYPLAIGNYWIYEKFFIMDSTESFFEVDSTYVTGDTIINEKTYFVRRTSSSRANNEVYLRDSLGNIVDQNGVIYFSEYNFNDTLLIDSFPSYDLVTYYQMRIPDSSVTVDAGVFSTKEYRGTIRFLGESKPVGNQGYSQRYYAQNVGKVKFRNPYIGIEAYEESRLVRYHVE